ncbi:MAG: hypothetical protein EOO77_41425 [Oxalobacteraceae bacterium]|nr:MAG: hypothetical protein EOO77_41425 [Oxalobacteraceae bacterium]
MITPIVDLYETCWLPGEQHLPEPWFKTHCWWQDEAVGWMKRLDGLTETEKNKAMGLFSLACDRLILAAPRLDGINP